MSNNTNVTLNDKFTLPSRGKVQGIPATLTMRAMSLLDEKKRLASSGIRGLVNLINSCIIEPEGVDVGNFLRFDLDYAMIALRIISHGPLYRVAVTCPHCGKKHEEDLNLSEIPCKEVSDDFSPVFEMQLPIKGDTLKVHLLTFNELEKLDEEAQRVLSKFPNYEGNPADVLEYIYKINEVNGEKLPYPALKQYVENLSAADSIYFDQMYEEKMGSYGLDTHLVFTCDSCKGTFERMLPINDEFFRPQYYTTQR